MGKFRCAKDVRSVVMPQSVTMPILTVIGNKEMYIENFKSIVSSFPCLDISWKNVENI